MKRLRFLGNKRVEIEDVELPRPQEGDVLVRIRMSAVCGSEMSTFRSEQGRQGNPGHEAVGEIADACGQPTLTEGQRVAIHVVTSCGRCYWCVRGEELFCENKRIVDNCHAEYVAVPAHHCLPIPDDVPWDTALMIGGDTLGVAYSASQKAGVKAGEVAAVMGAGPIGLGHVCLLSFYGLQVHVVDLTPARLELAKSLGAAGTINATDEDPVAALRALNDGRGPDYVFDCAGSPQTLDVALQSVRLGGTVAIVGERGETPIYPSRDIIHRELRMFGSWYFRRHHFFHMVDLVRQGLKPERLITHRFPLDQAQKAYDLMEQRACGKVVLEQL